MNDDLKERCDVIRQELNEINVIIGKRTKSNCFLDVFLEEVMKKVKCKEIELSNLEVKISQDQNFV